MREQGFRSIVDGMIIINRYKVGDNVWLDPLMYSVARLESGGATAMMACSNGHVASLSDHEIAADGSVTPSVVCPETGCDFHEYVKLNGWTGT